MGCGCGGQKQTPAQVAASMKGNNGPSNPAGSYYWTGPQKSNSPKK